MKYEKNVSYEKKLSSRLKKKLLEYFPSEKLKITKIKKVSELYKEHLETITYKCVLKGTCSKILYVKYFTNHKVKKLNGFKNLIKFDEYRDELKIPRIYDFYEDLNSIVIEGVSGTISSKIFPIYLLPVMRIFYFPKIKTVLQEVAKSVAKLHTITYKKDKPMKTYSFNDLKLGNVLFDGDNAKIIDFEMVETHYMEDLVSFMVSLEMLQKFPYVSKEDVKAMKDLFLNEYSKNVDWKIDKELLSKKLGEKRREVLQTLEDKNNRRGMSFFEKIIMHWNIFYLKNRLGK